jgi:hypothetical protein
MEQNMERLIEEKQTKMRELRDGASLAKSEFIETINLVFFDQSGTCAFGNAVARRVKKPYWRARVKSDDHWYVAIMLIELFRSLS